MHLRRIPSTLAVFTCATLARAADRAAAAMAEACKPDIQTHCADS